MKKEAVIGIIILFVFMSFTSISGNKINNQIVKPSDKDNILYVGGSGPGNYSKIQDAVDNASDGDTVFVFDDSSPYYDNIVVDKSINLIGDIIDINSGNSYRTVIDGNYCGDVVFVSASWVNISRFTINGSYTPNTFYSGIVINSSYNNISDNNISNNYKAIGLCDSYNIIFGNILTKNVYGIGFSSSCNHNISFLRSKIH